MGDQPSIFFLLIDSVYCKRGIEEQKFRSGLDPDSVPGLKTLLNVDFNPLILVFIIIFKVLMFWF